MEKTDLNDEHYTRLLNAVFRILLEKGPSHTTMDLVAARLSMSKRTLYEIFGSKDDMLRDVMDYQNQLHRREMESIFHSTGNAMEAMAKAMTYIQKTFESVDVSFFRDMDKRCRHLRNDYDGRMSELNNQLGLVFALGIRQGVFRKGIDYDLQLRLLRVQMESLKRMEEFFPPEITLAQAYSAIAQGFLRGIATPQGIEILEGMINDRHQ